MTAAEVMLWGTRIGIIAFDEINGIASFEYDKAFLRSGIEVSPIMMPLSERVYSFPELNRETFHGLPGLFADSLPDKFGNAIINAWLNVQGRNSNSLDPVERLCYTGNRGMGALEYVPARGPLDGEGESVRLDQLTKLANDILNERESLHIKAGSDAMREIIKVGTSAGGARAKAVIAWNEETGDIRSGQIDAGKGYSYWLIKFDGIENNRDKEGADDAQHTRIEYAYYLMAKNAGIDMNECRLHDEGGRHHFMTMRFDRNANTGDKLHMQSLGGIAHFDFNMAGSYSYEQAAEIMRRLRLSGKEISQFYRRMVFNVLSYNRDDHVKNISFLMERSGKWKLAPAYDVTYAYNPDGMWTGTHQMTVNGKRSEITDEDIISAGRNMGIRNAEANKILDEVRCSIHMWNEFAGEAGLSEHVTTGINKVINKEQT